ncbi:MULTISPECIES: acetyl-CoA carboxylase [unclassified Rhizobium]|uniref:acetyl-CoA carboxylase n=1 Tax=unclassified Rhizobium TaxID=2613769 RepID=UPI000EA9AC4D|nr:MULTISPECIES: acetyl-CoA carboxylase [unclassified Rhizobium]AYG70106.1 acetyl-CoA carboxylase [Rhizobium sp. CCGE531]AYG76481.1 acetyl-CoA carboxylase [Rhizobium sp. CCGE532]
MSAIDVSDPAIIAFLADALTAAGVDGLEISRPGSRLRIVVSKAAGAQVSLTGSAQPGSSAIRTVIVKAPMAGHFQPLPASDSEGAERLPRTVAGEDVIGFIRIGSVLLPIAAGRSGLLTKLLVEPDTLAGFGDPLFEIEPIS